MVSWKEFSNKSKWFASGNDLLTDGFTGFELQVIQIKDIREWAFGRIKELEKEKKQYVGDTCFSSEYHRLLGQIEVFKELAGEKE